MTNKIRIVAVEKNNLKIHTIAVQVTDCNGNSVHQHTQELPAGTSNYNAGAIALLELSKSYLIKASDTIISNINILSDVQKYSSNWKTKTYRGRTQLQIDVCKALDSSGCGIKIVKAGKGQDDDFDVLHTNAEIRSLAFNPYVSAKAKAVKKTRYDPRKNHNKLVC